MSADIRVDIGTSPVTAKIEEYSLSRSLLGVIPIIGIFTNAYHEYLLADRIAQKNDPELLIKLIEIKNYYKISSIDRNYIQVIVAGIWMTQPGFVTAGAVLGIGSIIDYGRNAYHFYHNKKVIEILKNEGFKPGLAAK